MIRRSLLALTLVAGLTSAHHAVAGPFFNRVQAPSAQELGLDASQQAAWEQIQAQTLAFRKATLSSIEAELAETRVALADPDVDLRAIGADYQTIALTALMEQRQLRDQRLAFYDSLNPSQQAQVRGFLIQATEQAERALQAIAVLQGRD
ncbi:MAG: Spy/CpxP family protein refolding chaperone [Lysobacterales bacterium]|nr:Spy/CpxP family protein refolding chaperone [Xanthomonadales bacterium]MCB1612310.1 Spy/CpxP family protein refolding chaperone [Xanthomonadales bacterium]MCP5473284.1 Spy/CpxP family protein refolding chaperone [Rhodanobacteraceae bacterium]